MNRGATSCLLLIVLALIESQLAVAQTSDPGDWPQWRGPNRDGISHEIGLLKEWPEDEARGVVAGRFRGESAIHRSRLWAVASSRRAISMASNIICLDAKDGSMLWAVQPQPVISLLEERVAQEFKNADRDGNGTIDETEAWRRFGSQFNSYDRAVEGDAGQLAAQRAKSLFEALDENSDGKLSFAEAGEVLRDDFERFDAANRDADAAELAASRATALFAAIDKDQDGKIGRSARRTEVDRPFGRMDQRDPATNRGDDLLTKEEVESYLTTRQPGRDGLLTVTELETIAREFAGKDGILTREELRSFYGGYRNGMGDEAARHANG